MITFKNVCTESLFYSFTGGLISVHRVWHKFYLPVSFTTFLLFILQCIMLRKIFLQTPISLTLSCLKKHNIFNSRKTLLQETRFWKTLGIFLSATLFPSLGSVTDLQKQYLGKERKKKTN